MRVVGGRLSGRRFGATKGQSTRPTSDRVREALASALDARGAFDQARVLDLFAGTGALSFEAISRGAEEAVAVDDDSRAIAQISKSARELGIEACVRTVRVDLLGTPEAAIRKLPRPMAGYSLVFADAPYSKVESVPGLLASIAELGLLAPGAWIAVEHPVAFHLSWPNGLAPEAEYRYGHTGISLGIHDPEKGTP